MGQLELKRWFKKVKGKKKKERRSYGGQLLERRSKYVSETTSLTKLICASFSTQREKYLLKK